MEAEVCLSVLELKTLFIKNNADFISLLNL